MLWAPVLTPVRARVADDLVCLQRSSHSGFQSFDPACNAPGFFCPDEFCGHRNNLLVNLSGTTSAWTRPDDVEASALIQPSAEDLSRYRRGFSRSLKGQGAQPRNWLRWLPCCAKPVHCLVRSRRWSCDTCGTGGDGGHIQHFNGCCLHRGSLWCAGGETWQPQRQWQGRLR